MATTFFVVERNHPQFIRADNDDPARIQLVKGDLLHHSSSEDVSPSDPELRLNDPFLAESGVWLASTGVSHVYVANGDDLPPVDEPKPKQSQKSSSAKKK